jgi:hypothetical protein
MTDSGGWHRAVDTPSRDLDARVILARRLAPDIHYVRDVALATTRAL